MISFGVWFDCIRIVRACDKKRLNHLNLLHGKGKNNGSSRVKFLRKLGVKT
jgi:DNA-nicking Smr family endonuclease